jgi:endonuclease I
MRSDLHHLFPTRKDVNNARGNDPFAEIPDATTQTWYGINTAGQLTELASRPGANDPVFSEDRDDAFEPPEGHKGNLARALFYFYTLYPTQAGAIERVSDGGLGLLCDWHQQDPVDDWERQRNRRIEPVQGNRNPSVDLPGLTCRAWGCPCGD